MSILRRWERRGKGNCGKVKETIDVQRGYKTQKQGETRYDGNFEPFSYLNTTEIFSADAEL